MNHLKKLFNELNHSSESGWSLNVKIEVFDIFHTFEILAVSQFQERREWTCFLVETGLVKLPWKNELGRTREHRTHSCEN